MYLFVLITPDPVHRDYEHETEELGGDQNRSHDHLSRQRESKERVMVVRRRHVNFRKTRDENSEETVGNSRGPGS